MLKFQNVVSSAVIAFILSVWTLSVVQYSEKNTTFWKLNQFPSTNLIGSDRNRCSQSLENMLYLHQNLPELLWLYTD